MSNSIDHHASGSNSSSRLQVAIAVARDGGSRLKRPRSSALHAGIQLIADLVAGEAEVSEFAVGIAGQILKRRSIEPIGADSGKNKSYKHGISPPLEHPAELACLRK
jgi:hypothetical protein